MKIRSTVAPFALAALALLALAGAAHAQWNSCGVAVCTNPSDQFLPVVASDNAGGAIVAWADQRTATLSGTRRWMIYAQRLNSLGVPQWAAGGIQAAPDTAVADSLFDQQNPAIVADGSGGAFVAWVDAHEYPSTDIYLQHLDATGAPAWRTLDGGLPVCQAPNVQQFPVLVLDGAGGVIVTWQDCRNGVNFDIYAQRVNAAGVPQWAANGVPISTANDSQTRPQAVSDGNNGAIIVWSDNRYLSNLDAYAQRVDGSGNRLWKVNVPPGQVVPDSLNGFALFGVAGFAFPGDQQNLAAIADGSGGAIVVCEDSRSQTNFDLYGQHVDGTGTLLWTAGGAAIANAPFDQRAPSLCTDGAAGAIVAWHDFRKGPLLDADIYTQHVNASGVLQWGTAQAGTAACLQDGNQLYPTAVTDGAGGAILVWYDGRGTAPNLFTQRFNAAGAAQWTTDGVKICGIPYGGYGHSAIADGAGGAIAAWQDARTTNSDIYAARVTPSGSLGAPSSLLGVGDAAQGGLVLDAPRPNPTLGAMSVRFVLPSAAPATLELIDVGGRLIERHQVGLLGPGAHVLSLGGDRALHAGLYFVRLRQGGLSRYAKASVVP